MSEISGNGKSQYWFVIKELTSREIKRKYARSYLGIAWSVLNPLLNMIVMSLIFSYMFRRSIENYPIYYLTGHVLWDLFRAATNNSMTTLVDNKSLLLKAKLPKQTFVLSRVYTSLVNLGYTMIAYAVILFFFQIKITWRVILLIPDILLLLLFTTGLSLALSILYVFFADIKHLYSVLMTLWMYLSAIFYPAERLPEFMQQILALNPIYLAIDIARYTVMYGMLPYYTEWIKLTIYAVGMFVFGVWLFKKKENDVMQSI